jgi:hypothetical protein
VDKSTPGEGRYNVAWNQYFDNSLFEMVSMPAEFNIFVIEHQQKFVVFTATTLQLFFPQFHIVKVRSKLCVSTTEREKDDSLFSNRDS